MRSHLPFGALGAILACNLRGRPVLVQPPAGGRRRIAASKPARPARRGDTPQDAERLAAAQAKRDRKNARRAALLAASREP